MKNNNPPPTEGSGLVDCPICENVHTPPVCKPPSQPVAETRTAQLEEWYRSGTMTLASLFEKVGQQERELNAATEQNTLLLSKLNQSETDVANLQRERNELGEKLTEWSNKELLGETERCQFEAMKVRLKECEKENQGLRATIYSKDADFALVQKDNKQRPQRSQSARGD